MNQHTAPAAARPSCAPSVFAPGGCTWVPVPVGLDGPGLHAWMALMVCRRGVTVTAPDRVLAAMARRSARTIQEGLRQLEAAGLIERTRRHGARVIAITGRLAGNAPATSGQRAGNFSATSGQHGGSCTDSQPAAKPYRSPPAAPIRSPVPAPSYGGETAKKQAVPPAAARAASVPVEMDEPEVTLPPAARAALDRIAPAFAATLDRFAPRPAPA